MNQRIKELLEQYKDKAKKTAKLSGKYIDNNPYSYGVCVGEIYAYQKIVQDLERLLK